MVTTTAMQPGALRLVRGKGLQDDHVSSKAERDGKFCGLMFDEDNQYNLSEDRANEWVVQLQSEGFM